MNKLAGFALKTFDWIVILVMIFSSPAGVVAAPLSQAAAPTIVSDQADYPPGALVTLVGAGWLADTTVQIVVDDLIGKTWTYSAVVDVVDAGFVYAFTLPTTFISDYIVTATGVQSGQAAQASFTDAAALTLTKLASPLTYTAAGQVINFGYDLKNTGSTSLNGPFTVTDNKVASVSCPGTATLAAGASITCAGTYTVTAGDVALGYAVNTATASSSNPGATTSNADVRIVSLPVECRNDSDGANDEPGQKDLTQECINKTKVNPLVLSWNWDVIKMSGSNSADGCALFDTDGDGLANYSMCASWQGNRIMQAGYPQLYSCNDTRSDRCAGDAPLSITNGSTCALELSPDDPFAAGDGYPNDAKVFCSINLADVGGATKANLIDVCSYPSVQPNSDPSDCVIISADRGNLEVIKSVVPDDTSTKWDISWTGATPYSTTLTGSSTTGIQAVLAGTYDITEAGGTGTSMSAYSAAWACTVDGSPLSSGTGTTITGLNVPKGSVVICTFTNTRKTGSLEIKKDVVPDNAGTNWNFTTTGPTAFNCSIAGDGTCGATTVDAGSYTIAETAGTATTLADYNSTYACTVNGSAGASGSGTTISGVTTNSNDTVVCTFTNTQRPGTLTVNKVLVPSADAGKFSLQIDGNTKAADVGDGGTTGGISVSAGSHTVGEIAGTATDLADYVTTIGGDCDSSGNVTVGPNESKTCTITNTRKGNIIIKKVTDPAGQAGDFTFSGAASGTIQDGGQLTASNLAPKQYSVTETSLASEFDLESIVCDDDNSTVDLIAKKAIIQLDPGETVTCTFTNKKLNPDLAIKKTADAASVTAGDAVGFTIDVKNKGLGTAKNVTLSDTLPAIPGVTWAISPAVTGCSIVSGTLSCSFGDMAPQAVLSVHVTGTTTGASCGTWNNTATVQADNNMAQDGRASLLVDCASIAIAKTPASSTVSAGDTIGFTIVVTNNGSGTARGVVVSDTLPANPGLGAWTLGGADAAACSISNGVLTCSFGDVVGHASKTVTLTATTSAATCGTVNNTASVTTTNDGSGQSSASVAVECPHLEVAKTSDAATVNAGDTIGFSISVTNSGSGVARNVALLDTLPTGIGITWSLAQPVQGCTITGSILSCSFGDLAKDATKTVHLTSPTIKDSCGTYNNTATATAGNQPSVTSQASVEVQCASIYVTKVAAAENVSAGDAIGFTITVGNAGPGSAYGVSLSDTLPTNSGLNWTIDPAVTGCSISAGVLTCSFGTLAANAQRSVSISSPTTAASCGAVANTADVSTTNDGSASASDSIAVKCPDVTVTKTAAAGTISAGDTAAFKVVVKNIGTGNAYGVTVNDTLPAGITWGISPAVTGCSITGNTLSCSFASLAAGASVEINVSGATSPALCGKLDNSVAVAATNEANLTNNTASASITVNCPDVTVTKEAASGTINAGDTGAFKIVVTNSGAGTAYNATVSDTLPAGVTWSIDPAVTGCSITGNTLSCSFASLAAGASVEIHVSGTTSAAVCGKLDNTVTVAAANEANTGNNSASASITVNCADVTVTKEAVSGTINASDTAAFKIVVANSGAGTAYNVTVQDTLPAGITWSLDPAVTGCAISNGVLSCAWASLASGASVEITVKGNAPAAVCGKLDNTVTVAATNEANTSNNSAKASITVNCPDVTVTKTAGAGTISAGDTAAFKIVVANSGAGTAYNVTLNDTLPAGITWGIDPAVTGCAISGGVLSCSWATLAAGASVEINVSGTTSPAVCGKLDNTATASASNEANTSNNSSKASITVNCPDVKVTKTAADSSIYFGEDAIYNIVVENIGLGKAYNVTLSDTLPGTVDWTLVQPVPGCTLTGGNLSCAWSSLDPAAKITIQLKATIASRANCANLSNTVTVAATNEKAASTANNTSTATITVTCPVDLTVSKTAKPAFKRTFYWDISKGVDKTEVRQVSGNAIFNYTVAVKETEFADSDWVVTGKITVVNPNSWIDIPLTGLTDLVDNGGVCTIPGFSAGTVVPKSGSLTFDYTCTYALKPSPYSGINTATATWDPAIGTPNGTASNTASFAFDTGVSGNPTNVNKTVTVTDTFKGVTTTLGSVTAVTTLPYTEKTFSYARSVPMPAGICVSYTNTARIVETGQLARQTVTVCGSAKTGARTIGFWKETNGANLLTTYCVKGTSNLGIYLRGLGTGSGPFSNAPIPTPTTCGTLATYVFNVLNGASSTDMNKMLRAQMMATALDVWFTGPGWTSTKINAVKPPSVFFQHNNLGTFQMETTAVCPRVGSLNTGTVNCSNGRPGTNAVLAGVLPASPMTMQAILDYAASVPPFNGLPLTSVWYSGNRTKQEILKNLFDQFNNQMAFGTF